MLKLKGNAKAIKDALKELILIYGKQATVKEILSIGEAMKNVGV